MADNKSTLEQMLENLVNDNQEKAEELFHEYVVTKSREIYENLIEEEMTDDEEVDEASDNDDEEAVDEASDNDDDDAVEEATDESSDDEDLDEEFEDIAIEAEDDMADMPEIGGDETDDLESDIDADEEGEKEPEELFQDLDSIVDELQAKFDEIKGVDGDEEGEPEMDMGAEEEAFAPEVDELDTFREYVEKVAGGHGAEKKGAAESGADTKSVVDNMKNDMGGTSANIAKGGEASGKNTGGLADITPKEQNAGNVNTPGSKTATKMDSTKGHGAEKKGSGESADNKQSIFRSKR
jgi:hypothetical protein|tara:strand:+ start:3288 stop:4175 length:888 start_codon:yes stop_codon:yes gene_type:complete